MNANGIPRIIHQIWIQGVDLMPPRYRELTATWSRCNPSWTHRVWDESSLRALLGETRWWPVYAKQHEFCARADVARYALLQRFGGVYADVDTECRRAIDALVDGARITVTLYSHPRPTVSRLDDVTNSIIASVPAHPIWDDVLAWLEDAAHDHLFVTERTGPRMLARFVETYAPDARLVRFPHALTTAILPSAVMRAFSRIAWSNRVLDYNDAGRARARYLLRRAWQLATRRAASYSE